MAMFSKDYCESSMFVTISFFGRFNNDLVDLSELDARAWMFLYQEHGTIV